MGKKAQRAAGFGTFTFEWPEKLRDELTAMNVGTNLSLSRYVVSLLIDSLPDGVAKTKLRHEFDTQLTRPRRRWRKSDIADTARRMPDPLGTPPEETAQPIRRKRKRS